MRLHSSPKTILLSAILASVAAFATHGALSAEVKKCSAVKELAKAGHYSFDTVNVTADVDNDVCSFSVNGATVDSPPQMDVINALESLIGKVTTPGSFFTQQQTDLNALALLLLASSPVVDIDEMVSFLSEYESELAVCRTASLKHRPVSLHGADDTRFFCGVTLATLLVYYIHSDPFPGSLTTLYFTRKLLLERDPPQCGIFFRFQLLTGDVKSKNVSQ